MKNKLLFISIVLLLLAVTSCQKDLTGNAITVEIFTNDSVNALRIYNSCQPGSNNLPLGTSEGLTYLGNGNYHHKIEGGYENPCFTITGTIPENNSTTGVTTVSIDAYYTEEGNVVGFQDLEIKRPHDEQKIRYEFRPDTYIE